MSTQIATGLASLGSNIGALEFKSIKIISKTILNLFAISGGAMMSVSSSAMIGKEEFQYPFIEMDYLICGIALNSIIEDEFTDRIGNFQPLDFNSEFGQEIIKGFNSFEGEAKEVIIQQLEGLRAECKAKGVRLLLCVPDNKNIDITMDATGTLVAGKYLKIYISQEAIEKQMNIPIYFVKKESKNSISIHAQPLRELVGDDVGKCAAYLLVHEFSHVHSALHLSEGIKDDILELKAYGATKEYVGFIEKYDIPESLKEAFKTLFGNLSIGEEIRNTMKIVEKGGERIPGEFELLNALHPGITRMYMGSKLDFSDDTLLKALHTLISEILNDMNFDIEAPIFIDDESIGITELEAQIENCFEKILGKNYNEKYLPIRNDIITEIYNKFQNYRQTNVIVKNLDLFQKIKKFQKENDSVKIGNSIFETKYKFILNELENLLKEIDIKKGYHTEV